MVQIQDDDEKKTLLTKRLNERYEAWVSTYDKGKLLIIDVDENSYNENQEDLGKIVSSIDAKLHGLF